MADIRAKVETARKAGYSDAEIKNFLFSQPETIKAREAGYTDDEIAKHFGLGEIPPSRGVAGYIDTTLGNIPQDVMNIAQGAYTAVTDPMATLQGVAEAVESPVQTGTKLAGAAYQAITNPLETFQKAPVSTILGLTAARGLAAPVTAGAGQIGRTAATMVRNAMNPKARMYGEVFGAQMPEAINALAAAQPGMTSAQALADVNAPAIQAIGEKVIQQVPQEARAVQQAQEASRAARIGQIAGTPEELAAAQETRATAARANYAKAFAEAAPDIPADLLERPSMKAATKVAEDISAERGGVSTPMEALHNTKLALDKIVAAPEDYGIAGAQKAAIQDTRKKFISELEKNDAYKKARTDFAAQSVPINKMQVAQELQKALTAPVTGEATRAGMFARAAEEAPKTIKRATGQEFFTKLEDVLSPEEMSIVNDVRDEFRRTQLAKDQAKLAKSSAEELASAQIGPISHLNLLNRVWTITNTIIKRSLGKIDERLATQIGMEMLDPAQMKKALQAAQEYNAKTEAIKRGVGGRRMPAPPVVSGTVTFQNVMSPENRNAMAR